MNRIRLPVSGIVFDEVDDNLVVRRIGEFSENIEASADVRVELTQSHRTRSGTDTWVIVLGGAARGLPTGPSAVHQLGRDHWVIEVPGRKPFSLRWSDGMTWSWPERDWWGQDQVNDDAN